MDITTTPRAAVTAGNADAFCAALRPLFTSTMLTA
jgi:hypothetical protein